MPNTLRKPDSEDTIERHIGRRLKRYRRQHGLSPGRVDELSGCPEGTCQRLEQGGSSFGPTELYALARTFGIDPSGFFDGLPLRWTAARCYPVLIDDPALAKETENLVTAFRGIDDAGLRRTIIKLISAVADDPSRIDGIVPPP